MFALADLYQATGRLVEATLSFRPRSKAFADAGDACDRQGADAPASGAGVGPRLRMRSLR